MQKPTKPTELSANERLTEVGKLLSLAIIRLYGIKDGAKAENSLDFQPFPSGTRER